MYRGLTKQQEIEIAREYYVDNVDVYELAERTGYSVRFIINLVDAYDGWFL